MPGPKYHYLNVRDNLRIGDSCSGQISFRDNDIRIYSDSDGNLLIKADSGVSIEGTLDTNGAFNVTGDLTMTGDLVQRYAKYISGTSAATVPTGYTRCTKDMEIIDDGIAILSGKSGNILPKLPATPVVGRTLIVIYQSSGVTAAAQNVASLSGSSIKMAKSSNHGTASYLTFKHPGQTITITNDGSSYYVPSSNTMPATSRYYP